MENLTDDFSKFVQIPNENLSNELQMEEDASDNYVKKEDVEMRSSLEEEDPWNDDDNWKLITVPNSESSDESDIDTEDESSYNPGDLEDLISRFRDYMAKKGGIYLPESSDDDKNDHLN